MFSMDFATGLGGVEWIEGLVVIILIILPVLFTIIYKSNKLALGLIFILAFTRVFFHFAGLPRMVPSILTEVCVLTFFTKAFYYRFYIQKRAFRIIGFYPMLGVLLLSIISVLVNGQVFIFYIFFLALMNLDLSENTVSFLNRLIIFLFLIQLPAAALKYLFLGQQELWAGTVSWQAGQFGTTLPLFAIAFLIAFYYIRKSFGIFFILYLGFVFFGIIGQKRALPVFIPSVLLLAWFLNWRDKATGLLSIFSVKQLKSLALVVLFAFVALSSYTLISKDEMFMHGLNPKKLIEYVYWYNTRDDMASHGIVKENITSYTIIENNMKNNGIPDTEYAMGRGKITKVAFHHLRRNGVAKIFLGFGPGAMISSPHLGRNDISYNSFGFRGAVTGFIVFLLQLGVIGVILFTCLFFELFIRAYSVFRTTRNKDLKMVALGFMGVTYVFLLDFFFYSQSTFFFGVLTPTYFYIATIVMRKDYHGYRLFGPLKERNTSLSVPAQSSVINVQEKITK